MTDPSNAAQSLWMQASDAPSDRLRDTVAALTRARHLQLLVDYGFAGLVAGLVLATVAVLVAKWMSPQYPPFELIVAAVTAPVAVALVFGWHRRPGALDIAIRADLALRLKQRLSTAWEVMSLRGDAQLAERLAAQAVKAGLPARPGLVFPLRLNRWARLAPVAATALLLASVLDLSRIQAPAFRTIDERVVDEGQRLSAFAREMQARAAREELPRAAKQAGEIERLGVRMESGGLSRGESLGLLRQLAKALDADARQARADANAKNVRPFDPGADRGSPLNASRHSADMADRMLRSLPKREDSAGLREYLSELARSGIPRQQAEEALKRYQEGDNEAIRDILAKLAQIERARREQEELHAAREQVSRAQENLGESLVKAEGDGSMAIDLDEDERSDRSGDPTAAASSNRRFTGETRGASRHGTQSDSSVAAERQAATVTADAVKSGPIVKPQGDVREGEELVTQGQVLPRVGRPSVENVQMRAEFASQVEEVLSKEQYPAHAKEFVRRYFLHLSQGRSGEQKPRGAQ